MEVIACRVNADWDAIGSLLAARRLYPGAALAMPEPQSLLAADGAGAALLRSLPLRRPDEIDFAQVTRLVLIGVRRAAELGALAELAQRPQVELHIFDHRPPSPGDLAGELELTQPAGACVTLLVHLLSDRGSKLTADEAAWALAGLYDKTGGLLLPTTTPRDLRMAALLLEWGGDLTTVAEARRHGLDPERVMALYDLLQTAQPLPLGGMTARLAETASAASAAALEFAVERLHALQGADATLALVQQEGRTLLVGRARPGALDLQDIAAGFGARGEATAIAVSLPGMNPAAARERLMKTLGSKVGPPPRLTDLADPRVSVLSADATVQETVQPFLTSPLSALAAVTTAGHVKAVVERRAVDRALHHGLFDLPVVQLSVFDPVCGDAESPPEKLAETAVGAAQSVFPVVAGGGRFVGAVSRADLFAAAGARPAGRRLIQGSLVRAEGESLARGLARALPAASCDLLASLGRLAGERGGAALLVGGAVRDLLLGRPIVDLDLVVEGDAPALAREFAERTGASVNVHEDFRTATVTLNDRRLDLATARREFYERPGALPKVEPASWREDAERRDFTINAMMLDLRPDRFGALHDGWNGQDDLHNRRVRVLHGLSFVDDPTRIFRAARFARRLGFEIEERTEKALRAAVERGFAARLAGPRIWKELELIFAEERPAAILEWLLRAAVFVGLGLPTEVDPERARVLTQTGKMLAWRQKWRPDLDLQTSAVWVAALTTAARDADRQAFLARLETPAGLGERAAALRAAAGEIIEALEAGPERPASQIAATLRARPSEAAFLAAGLAESDVVRRAVRLYFTDLSEVQPEIGGEELIALGLAPGPTFREILDRIRDARLDGMVKTRSDELALAKKLAGQGNRGKEQGARRKDEG